MKPVKYTLFLIVLLLSPINIMGMTEEDARDCLKEFVNREQEFGKFDETLKLTFANAHIDDNGIKIVFNKEDDFRL